MDKRQIPFGFLAVTPQVQVPDPPKKRERQMTLGEVVLSRETEHMAREVDRQIMGHGQSLEDARLEMMSKVDDGTTCPCCGGHVQRYERSLNSGMAASLCWLVNFQAKNGNTFVDLARCAPRYVLANRELGKLAHWGLVESEVNEDSKKKASGKWMATKTGIAFAKGEIVVPRSVTLLNNVPQGWSKKTVSVRQALGTRFDYEKLMDGES